LANPTKNPLLSAFEAWLLLTGQPDAEQALREAKRLIESPMAKQESDND